MAALEAAIHFNTYLALAVDGRVKPGHDDGGLVENDQAWIATSQSSAGLSLRKKQLGAPVWHAGPS